MTKITNLIGTQHGQLTILKRGEYRKNATMWICICTCGNTTQVDKRNLVSGHTKSCGCLKTIQTIKYHRIHGEAHKSREWTIWCQMRARCNSKTSHGYSNYGGRGIKVCAAWNNSYAQFLKDMGRCPDPEYSIERIENNGNYEPSNCKWGTRIEQANNKRNVRKIEFEGKIQTLPEWCRELGLKYEKIRQRINRHGWSIEKSLTTL